MNCNICKRPCLTEEGERCQVCRRALQCFCRVCRTWLTEHGWGKE